MITHHITLKRFEPLSNQYEGTVEFTYNGRTFYGHTTMRGEEDWDTFHPHTMYPVNLELDQTGILEKTDTAPLGINHIKSILYTVTGVIISHSDIELVIRSEFLLNVYLDISPMSETRDRDLQIGDIIQVIGTLQVDFYPEEDSTPLVLQQ